MAISRRSMIQGLAGAAALPLAGSQVRAQGTYPAREIKVVCAFPAGSGADVFARFFAEGMKKQLPAHATVIVENKVGASGLLATTYVAKARPDGYTVFIHAPSAVATNQHLFKNPGIDARKDMDVLASVCKLAFTVSVAANSPYKDLRQLIAAVKAKGDKASYATTAPTGQVAGALMKDIKKLTAVEVPYRTANDSLNDLTSGNLDYAMYDPIFALAQQRAGRVRVLAMSSKERMKAAPEIPTMDEMGVTGVDVVGWWGIMVPKGVPGDVRKVLEDAFVKMAQAPDTAAFLKKFGGDPYVIKGEQAQKQFLADVDNWGKWVKVANIKPRG